MSTLTPAFSRWRWMTFVSRRHSPEAFRNAAAAAGRPSPESHASSSASAARPIRANGDSDTGPGVLRSRSFFESPWAATRATSSRKPSANAARTGAHIPSGPRLAVKTARRWKSSRGSSRKCSTAPSVRKRRRRTRERSRSSRAAGTRRDERRSPNSAQKPRSLGIPVYPKRLVPSVSASSAASASPTRAFSPGDASMASRTPGSRRSAPRTSRASSRSPRTSRTKASERSRTDAAAANASTRPARSSFWFSMGGGDSRRRPSPTEVVYWPGDPPLGGDAR